MPTPAETARAAARRVKIVDALIARRTAGQRPPFTRELAREHGVVEGTIRLDLRVLERLGVIERDGTAGGIRLDLDKLEQIRARA